MTKHTETNTQAESGPEKDLARGLEIERPVLESMLELSDAAHPDSDGLEYLSDVEDPINIPEDSVVDTESSDGRLGVHDVYEDESDGDHEKDEDYVMDDASDKLDKLDSDEDIDALHEPMKGKGKTKKVSPFFPLFSIAHYDTCQDLPKPQKGNFRRDVNNARTNSAIAGNTANNYIAKTTSLTAQKRKEPTGANKPL